ncbi:short-chain dehydrogenase [Cordyceps javanica]|uniref:Short-chain dehydrogenase n=1 Tax=Cordyceps javanica TaxID=43265 RepID=A0A545VS24_9HYPO|nr:short-chain dehydrogenase [Cordyceps javanica]TQW04530.1 short-chain dehydrogenase [Cordyceps javanica]
MNGDNEALRQGKPNAQAKTRPAFYQLWTWECISIVFSAGLHIAIAAVLVYYDGRPLPQWPNGTTINTLVALMSTALRACLLAVLTSIIGQAKWQWLYSSKPRRVRDFQVFDQASRGMVGSLRIIKLLASEMLQSIVPFLAAVTLILSIAISPFLQQAVRTTVCDEPAAAGEASLPVAQALPGADSHIRYASGHWEPGIGLKSAFVTALMKSGNVDAGLKVKCKTGNCTFPTDHGITHSTVAMCSKCIETSKYVTKKIGGLAGDFFKLGSLEVDPWTLRNGTKVMTGALDLADYSPPLPSDFVEMMNHTVADISILSQAPYSRENETFWPVAAACSLYFCKQDIEATVQSNELVETVLSSTLMPATGELPKEGGPGRANDRMLAKTPCLIDGRIYTAANFSLLGNRTRERGVVDLMVDGKMVAVPADCVYLVHSYYAWSIRTWLYLRFFNGHCGLPMTDAPNHIVCGDRFWLARLYDGYNVTFAYQEQAFTNLAASVTNFLRTDGTGPWNFSENPSEAFRLGGRKRHINGIAIQKTACMTLRWPWLLFSCILNVITLILFVMSLFTAHQHRDHVAIWKSSLLPLLCLDIRPDKSEMSRRVIETRQQSLDELEDAAKATNLCLREEGEDSDIELRSMQENSAAAEDDASDEETGSMLPNNSENDGFESEGNSELY